jgi:hypothetical protein
MPLIRAGFRRLYDAIGCSLAEQKELTLSEINITSKISGAIYLGPTPRFGIALEDSNKYIVPGEQNICFKAQYHRDVSKSGYPRSFFLEIFVFKDFEVPEDIFHAFYAKDSQAQGALFQLVENEGENFKAVMDLLAGIIGLRFHRQFVIKLINENLVALRGENDFAIGITSSILEVLEGISLNFWGAETLKSLCLGITKAPEDVHQFAARVLKWLLRAWVENDPTKKFIALFIPLEIVLNRISTGPQIELRQMAKKIRRLIQNHGGEEKKTLLEFFNRLVERQKPSIVSRFEVLAQEANMPGYEQDIEAFKQFNKLRTRLLHEGEEKVPLAVSVTPEELCHFEDLVERYVNYVLFRNHLVYPSRWRSRRLQGGKIRNGE